MKRDLIDKIKRRDRFARQAITAGGLLVIISVISILVLIAKVALPLFYSPSATVVNSFVLPKEIAPLATGLDDYLESGFVLDKTGTFSFYDLRSGKPLDQVAVVKPAPTATKVTSLERSGKFGYVMLWDDGSLSAVQVKFSPGFDQSGKRTISHELETIASEAPIVLPARPISTLFRKDEEKGLTRVDLLSDNRIIVSQKAVTKDFLGNESVKSISAPITDPIAGEVKTMALDQKGQMLYAGTDQGVLLRWDLSSPESPQLTDNIKLFQDGRAITAVTLVLGDISVAVGDDKGEIATWFPVADKGLSQKRLTRIHQLEPHTSGITRIVTSLRTKSLMSLDRQGGVHLDHVTSERHLLSVKRPQPLTQVGLSAKGNGLIGVDANNAMTVWELDIPHPEVSLSTLFGKVWYESYDEPAYVWQSSASNDDFEPKISLTPLIFGTLKGTFYALIFAVPLALLGAIYTSQFLNQKIKSVVKPAVEIMAAIPSVVIGFLAGLWLAPIIDKSLVTVFLSLIVVPGILLLSILLWQRIKPASRLEQLTRGHEFLILIPVIALSFVLVQYLSTPLEAAFFAGDSKLWLYNHFGMRVDQRNSIIIALALGFAVIPIIFTISEDALSNVPKNLSAASLALGASRWQTAWRVVLPSAIPGIFSAIMIGFGRAVGETMIILMATGNTPIINWSIFNGFRSLSANIAVEIPEAPVFGTLYRVLFLSAVLLFGFTFIINTLAEVLRQRFRKKYGRY